MLNNYKLNIENLLFWLENESMVIRFANIENSTYPLIDGKYRYFEPEFKYTNIDSLINDKFKIKFNKENFIHYINRYVKPYCNDLKIRLNDYPISLDMIFDICNLNKIEYNIDSINETILSLSNNLDLMTVIENNKLVVKNFDDVIDKLLSDNTSKVIEYHNGKKNIVNMFVGLLLTEIKDNNINKNEIMKTLIDKLNKYKP